MKNQSKQAIPQASPATKKAIRFFNGKTPATDLLESPKASKFHHSGGAKSLNDKFFDMIESKKLWSVVALGITTAFIVAVAYWGIKQ